MTGSATPDYSVVVPTVGRPSLARLLDAIGRGPGPRPRRVVVVDDRRVPRSPLELGEHGLPVCRLSTGGRGPAAARNAGWRATRSPWVVFVDDDVVPTDGWRTALAGDLTGLPWPVAGSQGRLRVPAPPDRRRTDWERSTAQLEDARWITADLAYRRDVLEEVGGFDERFPRAYREDADLGLRVTEAGYVIVRGERCVDHPVRPADRWASVRAQAGNADDVLMRARHGPEWRRTAGTGPGRSGRHLATAAAGAAALAAAGTGHGRLALAAGAGWLVATPSFAVSRIRPGPRTAPEVATMALTSALIPPVAVAHRLRGWWRLPALLDDTARAPLGRPRSPLALQPPQAWVPAGRRPRSARVDVSWRPEAVLFDRDGTLVADRPGNIDPDRVAAMPGARAAVRRAREEGLAVGVVTNQAAVGRGTMTHAEVEAVNRRVDALLGPFDTWQVCPHAPEDGCRCRKPAPGLITAAAAALGVDPRSCAVVGDVGSDLGAAAAAGARGVLVPTPATRREEILAAPVVAPDLGEAVDLVLGSLV
jgi:histidinol-phosphate phosphatase family protein